MQVAQVELDAERHAARPRAGAPPTARRAASAATHDERRRTAAASPRSPRVTRRCRGRSATGSRRWRPSRSAASTSDQTAPARYGRRKPRRRRNVLTAPDTIRAGQCARLAPRMSRRDLPPQPVRDGQGRLGREPARRAVPGARRGHGRAEDRAARARAGRRDARPRHARERRAGRRRDVGPRPQPRRRRPGQAARDAAPRGAGAPRAPRPCGEPAGPLRHLRAPEARRTPRAARRSRCACATGPSPSASRSTRALPVRACAGYEPSIDVGLRPARGSSGRPRAAGSRPGTGCAASASRPARPPSCCSVFGRGVVGDSVRRAAPGAAASRSPGR